MKAALKQDILKILATLHQAHEEIRNNIKIKDMVSAQCLLGECQECAIVLGTTIEESEGEGFVTIPYIEEYCEIVYRIYQSLEVKSDYNINKIHSLLKRQLLRIENSVKNDIAVKKEFVFLPYKVSMWDSLESVWRAAKEDPECEAVVIPIPYYDKNPDGSLRSEYYEGNEFPEDVPVTYYEDYNFENRHPDAIFIHNPYDQNNYVTSVHPYFYSKNLKKLCDKLIYIPYYVSAETDPDNQEAMRDREGFVLSNGVLNADYVIVQSENTKKLFVNILEKNVPGISRSYWEKKILGLGSPKLDRINSVGRDDSRLPESWRKIIYTEKNIRKRVVFYNISVSTLLNSPEILEKIKDTLEYFKNNTDVALWWRPHPLYESTLASMRSGLLEEYRKMVAEYKEEGWGIFDEGVDLEWAIAETDAYYGDSSSVVQLYKEAQKPVMIQHVSVRATQEIYAKDIPIWPSCFFADIDDIWFVHGKMNVLMRYSMKEDYTYVINRISNEKFFQNSGYIGIYRWQYKIFLIPAWAREIGVYNILNKKLEKIAIDRIEDYTDKGLFSGIYVQGSFLYCIPSCYGAILKVNMENDKIEYIWIHSCDTGYINDSTRIEDIIISVYAYTNRFLIFDINTENIFIKEIGSTSRQFTNITNIAGKLCVFDEATHNIIEILGENHGEERDFYKTEFRMIKMFCIFSNYLLLDSVDSCDSQIIDSTGNLVFQTKAQKNIGGSNMYSAYYSGITNNNTGLIESFYFSRSMYSFCKLKKCKLGNQYSAVLKNKEYNTVKSWLPDLDNSESDENDIYRLSDWLKRIKRKQYIENRGQKNYGIKIHEIIKKDLYLENKY